MSGKLRAIGVCVTAKIMCDKKIRISVLKYSIANISLRHHGRWLADLNNTILHWEYAYITPAALSRRELVKDLGLLHNQAIAKYYKTHRTRLEAYLDDYLPAIATSDTTPEVCLDTFFKAVSPDSPPQNIVLLCSCFIEE